MKCKSTLSVWAAVCIVSVLAQAAGADDLYPPSYRGLAGSTTQEWDFVSPGVAGSQVVYYDAPDGTSGITNNPFATAQGVSAQAWVYGANALWQNGAWSHFDMLQFSIPDNMQTAPGTWKDLHLQVTFLSAVSTPPDVLVYHGSDDFDSTSSEVYSLGGGRFQLVQDWHIAPNPIQEFVEIMSPAPGFSVDQVVIDTICAPEPATLLLVGIGLTGFVLRRLRKDGR